MRIDFPILLLATSLLFLLSCGPAKGPHADAVAETLTAASGAASEAISAPAFGQLIVVSTAGWDSVKGILRCYEWAENAWQEALPPIPIVVGKNGMAWGRGLEDFRSRPGPVKREGDLRSPAGIFRLGTAFGYAAAREAAWVKLDYTPVEKTTMCIEDTASAHYNRIVDEQATSPDWNSTDHMRRKDDLYEWGVFVAHNADDPAPGGGSCIFLHVWRQNDSGTAGCTAMEKDQIKRLLAWIDPAAAPAIVQAPQSEYAALKKAYELPELP